jgi:Protein of unknown function (DUF3592)
METPTRLPEPPRTVRGGPGCMIWFVRVFILPHMVGGVVMAVVFVLTVIVALWGTDSTGSVLALSTSHGRKGGTTYNVQYRYCIDWRCFTNSASVGSQLFQSLSGSSNLEGAPAPVKVRVISIGRLHFHVFTEEHSAWDEAGPLLLFVLFWNAILSVFVYVIWVAPLRDRALVRNGQVASGNIVSKRERRGRGVTYFATFRFTDPASGQEIKREMTLPSRAKYDDARTGKPVTVIYDPRKPKRAVAYELGSYRIVAPDASYGDLKP